MMQTAQRSRAEGALWGSLVGDALGVPVEFMSREAIKRNPVTGMRGYGTHNQPLGTWSDDSSMLLCTVESLLTNQALELEDLGKQFVRWKQQGHWTPHGRLFDIGIATSRALSRIASGVPAHQAGGGDEHSNGNGSLMRILPVALRRELRSTDLLVREAHAASAVTHGHPRSQMACAYYCLLVRELLAGHSPREALATTTTEFMAHHAKAPFASELPRFSRVTSPDFADVPSRDIRSSGYVIDSLEASVWSLLTSTSFTEAVLKAVNLGEDTDTVGSITGGLAGAHFGIAAIPLDWKRSLARHDDVAALFEQFLGAASGEQPLTV